MSALTLAKCYCPSGGKFGIPTYPWRYAPTGLATRRQLRALGLRPGGQEVAAQVLRPRYRRGPSSPTSTASTAPSPCGR